MKIKKIQDLREKGITLIALVVTIIILLILAGVTLNMALSGDGLFNMARKAATDYNKKSVEEKLQILYAEKIMEDNDSNTKVKTDITDVLEEMAGGEITEEKIEEFNKLLEQYGEEVKGITTAEDLGKIGEDENYPIDGVYVQLSNIDNLTTQIGSKDKPFKGVYNGNGKSIKKLEIEANEEYTGMFKVNEGTIKNVKIENCQITSEKGIVGGIVGQNEGLIENCIISDGEINSENCNVGGICGYNLNGGVIRKCENSAIISVMEQDIGGICGRCNLGMVENCSNFGDIDGACCVGGIVGTLYSTTGEFAVISKCKNDGSISATIEWDGQESSCGGIVGRMSPDGKVVECENSGSVEGSRFCVGGISGLTSRNSSILSSVNNGSVTRT